MLSETELQGVVRSLFVIEDEEHDARARKRAYENIFDRVISKEILPRASSEQIERLYKWFVAFYKNACDDAGEEPREDLVDEDEWKEKAEREMAHIPEFELLTILQKIEDFDEISELEEYYEQLQKKVFPRATSKQIRKIMIAYDSTLQKLKHLEKKREAWREEEAEKIRLGLRKGLRVQRHGIYGIVKDVSGLDILVEWEDGSKTWMDARKVKILR